VKASIEDNGYRIMSLEQRQDTMMKEIETLRKHVMSTVAEPAPASGEAAPMAIIEPAPATTPTESAAPAVSDAPVATPATSDKNKK
jgi:hypothetical protein